MACNQTKTCAFYNKYKSDNSAKFAFIDNACAKDWPCARKTYKAKTNIEAPEDFSPAGTYIKKNNVKYYKQ